MDFGEYAFLYDAILNYEISKKVELALGTEFSWEHFGAGWGQDEKDMRLGDNGIIVSGPNSNAILEGNGGSANRHGTALFVGSGWHTTTLALFSEANMTVNPWMKVLLSGRVDKNTFTDPLFSPRAALISRLAEGHYLKLIAQKSIRMNTAAQLYTESQKGLDTNTETLEGLELLFSAYPNENLSFNLSGFRNNISVISWNGDDNLTIPIGDLQLYGIETDAKYNWNKGLIYASYTLTKLIDWELTYGNLRSGISYSDYNQPMGDGIQSGVGNDLANLANHSFKIVGRTDITKWLTLQVDSRVLWGFQGWKYGLTGLSLAMEGTVDEDAVENALAIVEDENTYDYYFRTNVSMILLPAEKIEVQFFVLNMLGANGNKRYSYDNGNDDPAPTGVRFIEEPRVRGN